MIVSRFSPVNNLLGQVKQAESFNYEGEVIVAYDQSSTCTGMVIGTRDKVLLEVFTFEREKRESPEQYFSSLIEWSIKMIQNLSVVAFVSEEFVNTFYVKSNRAMGGAKAAMGMIYNKATCLYNGQRHKLSDKARWLQHNNKAWKKEIVPRVWFQLYSDDVVAYHKFVSDQLPVMSRLKPDASAALCMYLYTLVFQYSSDTVTAVKSVIDYDHDLIIHCYPFSGLRSNSKEMLELADDLLSQNLNDKQKSFVANYRAGVAKHCMSKTIGKSYSDEYIVNYLEGLDNRMDEYLGLLGNSDSIIKQISFMYSRMEKFGISEFIFNDDLTVEQNARSFTNRDNQVYFTVIEKNLHYCYAIPMFDLLLKPEERILMVCTGY